MSYKLMPDDIKDQCVHTITQLTYDQTKLQTLYQRLKHLEIDYSELREKAVGGLFGSITLDEFDEDDEPVPGKNFMLEPEVVELVECFNPSHEINTGNIAITVYQPGFQFHPHIDFSRLSVLMFPILPGGDAGHAPIDYYDDAILGEVPEDYLTNKEQNIGADNHIEEHYLGSAYYSHIHPTLANTQRVHGVRNDTDDVRVFLQISLYDKYEDLLERIKTGEFLNVN